jgi:hypothetical protein
MHKSITIERKNNSIPVSKDSYWLLTEEKGFRVFNSEFIVFPLSVNTVILKHVCLHTNHTEINQI